MVAEDLNHTVWRTFCTAQPYRSQRQSLWRLAIALKQVVYAEQRLDVYSVSGLLPEEWARLHRQRPVAIASHNVHRRGQRARLVVLVLTLTACQRVGRSGPQCALDVFWTSFAARGFSDSPLWSSNLGPRQPGEPCPMTQCHEILLCQRSFS